MKIGSLAGRTGVSIRMLRYYEAEGLLQPYRTEAGYRDYAETDVRTVERIKMLNSAGLTLAMVREFLPCIRGDGPLFEPCDELKNSLRQQIARLDQTMGKLERSRAELGTFLRDIEEVDQGEHR